MAYVAYNNIRMAGVSAAVPKTVQENIDDVHFPVADIKAFMSATGVERFRVADPDVCTSDLALVAAEKLIADLKWDKSEIDMLLFISQWPDYILPNTSTILQDRLKLPKTCLAFDMTLGCSAYVYGVSVIAAMMSAGTIRKALFLCGDTPNKYGNKTDQSSAMLFGDAATATAFEYDPTAGPMQFSLNSDGAGYEAIIVPSGAGRHRIMNMEQAKEALTPKKGEDGIVRNKVQLILDGMSVFSFGISVAPQSVKETLTHYNTEPEKIDYYVFHQANLMMNEIVRKKLKLAKDKVPYSLKNYGNTSSASIPITMVTEMREQLINNENSLLLCGFGVGLSWGSCIVNTKNMVIPEIIEV